jgi:uncharacterized protein YjaG (DUF416 family)
MNCLCERIVLLNYKLFCGQFLIMTNVSALQTDLISISIKSKLVKFEIYFDFHIYVSSLIFFRDISPSRARSYFHPPLA